ncbi:MAG: oligosaccharide flippase family protein [Burkholderiaceae bacterium]|nr:oligosaccharide flippase family protein [Burkholderiaceae bacterium]
MSHIATRKQFGRNLSSGWLLLAAEVAVAFFLTPFIILKLGAAAYGIWSLMIGLIGYMGLVDIGLRGAVGRYVNHYMALSDQKGLSEVVSTSCTVLTGLAAIALLIALVIAPNFASIFPKTPAALLGDIAFALPLLTLGLWMSFISAILNNLLAAKEATYKANQYALFTLVLRTAGVVAVLGSGHGIAELVLVNLAVSVVGIAITFLTVRRAFGEAMPKLIGFSKARLKEMWAYGIATFVSRTASTMANDSAPIIGMWVLGPEAVAIYSVALTLTQNARRLQDMANIAIFPSVMKAGALRDMAGLRGLYLRFMDISFSIGALVFIGLMVFSRDFLSLWVGAGFTEGSIAVAVLAFGYLMQGIASTAPLTLHSLDRVGVTVKIGLWEAAACVVLTAALPMFGLGLLGLALGTTLPRLGSNLALYPWLAVRTMGPELRKPMWESIARNLTLCLAVGALMVALHWLVPGSTWLALIASVGAACVLHLILVALRIEGPPVIGFLTDPIRHWLTRRA